MTDLVPPSSLSSRRRRLSTALLVAGLLMAFAAVPGMMSHKPPPEDSGALCKRSAFTTETVHVECGGGVPGTTIDGYVFLADPTTGAATSRGIYGAKVVIYSGTSARGTPVNTVSSGVTGYFAADVSSGGIYTVDVSVLGYCAGTYSAPCNNHDGGLDLIGTYSISGGVTNTVGPFIFYPHPTYDAAANTVWFEYTDTCPPASHTIICQTYAPFPPTLYRSSNTGAPPGSSPGPPTLTVVRWSSEFGSRWAPSSGNANILKLYGTDNSAAGTGTAYAYFTMSSMPVPLSSAMFLTFNVLDWHTPTSYAGPIVSNSGPCNQRSSLSTPDGNGMVSVNAIFSDGTELRNVQDTTSAYIVDGFGRRVAPGYDQFRMNEPYFSGWYRVVVDLSELRYKTFAWLGVAYDNCGTGGSVNGASDSYFQVYFDDFRIEMAHAPADTPDAGFELSSLDGWGTGGNLRPTVTSTHPFWGHNSVLVGWDPAVYGTPSTTLQDSYLYAVVQVPYDKNYLNPSLSFLLNPRTQDPCLCTTNNWVKVYLRDRTTLLDLTYLFRTDNYDANTWHTWSFDLSKLSGHLVWLVIWVRSNVNGYATWGYFDEVRILPKGVSTFEQGATPGYPGPVARITLDPSIYMPASASFGTLPLTYAGYTPATIFTGGVAVAIDLHQFAHLLATNQGVVDQLDFSSTAVVFMPSGYALEYVQVTVHVTFISGDNKIVRESIGNAFADNLDNGGTYASIDPGQLLLTAASTIFDFGEALDVIPGGVVVDLGGSIALTLAGFIYGYWEMLNAAQPDPTTASTQWWASGRPFDGIGQAGGTAYSDSYLGAGSGGAYEIDVSVTAPVDSYFCGPNTCSFSYAGTVTGGYSLIITT